MNVYIGVLYPEVEESKGHFQVYGEFYIPQKNIESEAQAVSEVVGLEAYDTLIGAVAVFAQRGEVEAVGDTRGEVGTEIVVAHGAEFQLYGEVAIDRLNVARELGKVVTLQIALLPRIGDIACDECYARQETEVEPVPEAQVSDNGNVKSRSKIGGGALKVTPESFVGGIFEVELRHCKTHLDSIVQQAAVEFAEIAHLGIQGER